jgi:mannose-P-dolichol utilization defect protein 1
MILGATLVKFPQIIKIIKAQSAKGLVAMSYYTECLMNSISFCYHTHIGTPFNVFGDSLFLLLQSAITISLIWEYRTDISLKEKIFAGTLIVSFIAYLFTDAYVPEFMWTCVMNCQFLMITYARLPQIISNFKHSSTGQLSFVTCFLSFIGTVIRAFTVYKEARSRLVYFATGLQLIYSTTLVIQM